MEEGFLVWVCLNSKALDPANDCGVTERYHEPESISDRKEQWGLDTGERDQEGAIGVSALPWCLIVMAAMGKP